MQVTNQRLVKRIEILQSTSSSIQSDQKSSSAWSIWGSGSAVVTKEELDRLSKALSVAEEELEAKINENQHVHMRIFDIKQELQMKDEELH